MILLPVDKEVVAYTLPEDKESARVSIQLINKSPEKDMEIVIRRYAIDESFEHIYFNMTAQNTPGFNCTGITVEECERLTTLTSGSQVSFSIKAVEKEKKIELCQ